MLYRFAHKTGSYGVSIIEEDDNQVLVQIEQVIKHQNKETYITQTKRTMSFSRTQSFKSI